MDNQMPRVYQPVNFPDRAWDGMGEPTGPFSVPPHVTFRKAIQSTAISCVAKFKVALPGDSVRYDIIKRITLENHPRKAQLAFRELACLLAAEESNHHHVVPLFSAYCPQDWKRDASLIAELYFVFKPANGNLCHFIKKMKEDHDGISHVDISRILAHLTHALIFLHDKCNVIHRDLKPHNVGVIWDGKENPNLRAMLFDFGHSVAFTVDEKGKVKPRPNSAPYGVGTISYQSPEFLMNLDTNTPMDVWGLGCILGEMITGELLFPICLEVDEEGDGEGPSQKKSRPEGKRQRRVDAADQMRVIVSRLGRDSIHQWMLDEYRKNPEKNERLLAIFNNEKPPKDLPLLPTNLNIKGGEDENRTEQKCVELLRKMLRPNPAERVTLLQLKRDDYITAVGHTFEQRELEKKWYESVDDKGAESKPILHWQEKIAEILEAQDDSWADTFR